MEQLKLKFNKQLRENYKGTILVSTEGINGSLSCSSDKVKQLKEILSSNIRDSINIKKQESSNHTFMRLKIKIKKEIVTLGQSNLEIGKNRGEYILPKNWDIFLTQKNTLVIDTRNDYESEIGTFKKSIKTNTKSFRDFPKWVKSNEKELKNKKIAMFCTGGIRCEKASSFLKKKGYKNVYQLKGGIINYLRITKNIKKLWFYFE